MSPTWYRRIRTSCPAEHPPGVATQSECARASGGARARAHGSGIRELLYAVRHAAAVFWVSLGSTSAMGVWPLPPEEEQEEQELQQEQEQVGQASPTGRRLTGPAPGHPERLLPDVPPSRHERALWRQLTDLRVDGGSLHG